MTWCILLFTFVYAELLAGPISYFIINGKIYFQLPFWVIITIIYNSYDHVHFFYWNLVSMYTFHYSSFLYCFCFFSNNWLVLLHLLPRPMLFMLIFFLINKYQFKREDWRFQFEYTLPYRVIIHNQNIWKSTLLET